LANIQFDEYGLESLWNSFFVRMNISGHFGLACQLTVRWRLHNLP